MAKPNHLLSEARSLLRGGRLPEATAVYEKVLRHNPAQGDALQFLAWSALQQGDFGRAEALFARAVALEPKVAGLHVGRGLALRQLKRPEEALIAFNRAQAADPTLAEAYHQAGNVLKGLGRYGEAAGALSEAARLEPNQAAIWLNLGVAWLEGGSSDAALIAFQRALVLEPQRAEAHNVFGHALLTADRPTEAEAAFVEALRLKPGYAASLNNLGRLYRATGRLSEAVAHYGAALVTRPDPGTHSNLLFLLNFLPDVSPAEVFAEHRRWHESYAAPLPVPPPAPRAPPSTGRRLRVGYISPDFAHHAVAYFIEPVLAAHDRTRVEIFCYANVAVPDPFTARLRDLAEHWRDIARLDDDAAAALIRQDGLDLLIDLAGHSANHRLLVVARRPAPVQATWIGYPNTTGLDAVDYRITDAVSDPVGQTEVFHTERLVRMPENFSCYQPDGSAPPVNALPALENRFITFGCFNQLAKITPAVIQVWARLLGEVSNARLLLKSHGLDDPKVADRVRAGFAAHGIDAARLCFNGRHLSVADHLRLYRDVDIALDPFPYNGTTTTCEALWMGVPVLTLCGKTHAARVGASLLTHLGLTDWIAATPDDYVGHAASAARDLPRLAAVRQELRDRMRTSPLCSPDRFTRNLEEKFVAMAARQI